MFIFLDTPQSVALPASQVRPPHGRPSQFPHLTQFALGTHEWRMASADELLHLTAGIQEPNSRGPASGEFRTTTSGPLADSTFGLAALGHRAPGVYEAWTRAIGCL